MPPLSDVPADLIEVLRDLEVAIHAAMSDGDVALIERLLHDDFSEIGRSGRVWSRRDVLAGCRSRSSSRIAADDFTLQTVSPTVALLRYRSARIDATGARIHPALRASLWTSSGAGWRLIYHQGTPAGSDERAG